MAEAVQKIPSKKGSKDKHTPKNSKKLKAALDDISA